MRMQLQITLPLTERASGPEVQRLSLQIFHALLSSVFIPRLTPKKGLAYLRQF